MNNTVGKQNISLLGSQMWWNMNTGVNLINIIIRKIFSSEFIIHEDPGKISP